MRWRIATSLLLLLQQSFLLQHVSLCIALIMVPEALMSTARLVLVATGCIVTPVVSFPSSAAIVATPT